jgi:hypothetical protein
MVWKVSARYAENAETQFPMRVHMARKPVKSEQVAKNKAMMWNGNMKREVKK